MTLSVYSISDPSSPVVIYQTYLGYCHSGIIIDNHLYLGTTSSLKVFKVTSDLNQPLIPVKVIDTKEVVYKILRLGDELLLGENKGYLEVFDIETSIITSSHKFTEAEVGIIDILAIDDSHYLLAAWDGLLKTKKD
jgi:hypothetical protein